MLNDFIEFDINILTHYFVVAIFDINMWYDLWYCGVDLLEVLFKSILDLILLVGNFSAKLTKFLDLVCEVGSIIIE